MDIVDYLEVLFLLIVQFCPKAKFPYLETGIWTLATASRFSSLFFSLLTVFQKSIL